MKKLRGILPQSMLFQVYKALVVSHLRYADVVWGSLSEIKITALQRLQNRAFEIIQGSKIKDSLIRPTFSIDQMFQFNRSVLMYKMINKICPESVHDKFAERSSISKYDTRNKTDLQIPRLNLQSVTKLLSHPQIFSLFAPVSPLPPSQCCSTTKSCRITRVISIRYFFSKQH